MFYGKSNIVISIEEPVDNAFELILRLEKYAPKPLIFLLYKKKNEQEAYNRIIEYYEKNFHHFSSSLDSFLCLCNVSNLEEQLVDRLLDFAYQQNSWDYISLVSQSPSLKSIDTLTTLMKMEKTDDETLELLENIIRNSNFPKDIRDELKDWVDKKYCCIPFEILPELTDEELELINVALPD